MCNATAPPSRENADGHVDQHQRRRDDRAAELERPTTRSLETTQLRVTTGLKVNGPKDDAATYAIAQNMRGDIAGMAAVHTNLRLGQSITNVAIDAGKAIADLLIEMKAKSVQASQECLDTNSYTALNDEFTSLRA